MIYKNEYADCRGSVEDFADIEKLYNINDLADLCNFRFLGKWTSFRVN